MAQPALKPPPVRDCPDCRWEGAMKLQNNGIFTAHYICDHCGTALTVPPPPLVIPAKDFDPKA
jgi:rRNA maturation protein Nop10